jgi:hypothetical protein
MVAASGRPKPLFRGLALTAGAGLFGPPGACMVNPRLGMALTAVEVGMALAILLTALAILLTALYGNKQHSDRAFRLLRWAFDRAEPPARRAADQAR